MKMLSGLISRWMNFFLCINFRLSRIWRTMFFSSYFIEIIYFFRVFSFSIQLREVIILHHQVTLPRWQAREHFVVSDEGGALPQNAHFFKIFTQDVFCLFIHLHDLHCILFSIFYLPVQMYSSIISFPDLSHIIVVTKECIYAVDGSAWIHARR